MPLIPRFFAKKSGQPIRANHRRKTLQLESLEDRVVPRAGFPDLGFGNVGIVNTGINLGGLKNDGAEAVAVQPDGKTVIAGFAQKSTNDFDFLIARYDRDGDLDTTFNSQGFIVVSFNLGGTNEDRANSLVVQPDGKILVAGFATLATGLDFALCRLNSNGQLDTTFSGDGKKVVPFNLGGDNADKATSLALQSNGKILVAGTASTASQGENFAVARLLANGELDVTFDGDGLKNIAVNIGGTNNDSVSGIAVTSTGNILLAGTAENSSTVSEGALVRLTPTGALDTAFQGGIIPFRYSNLVGVHTVTSVALQADGKVLVTGKSFNSVGSDSDIGVARFNTLGQFDSTFSENGRFVTGISVTGSKNDVPEAVLVQQDGKIVVGGTTSDSSADDLFMLRLLPNGTLDSGFNSSGIRIFDQVVGTTDSIDQGRAMALSSDGIVLVGNMTDISNAENGSEVTLLRVVRDVWVIASADKGGPNTVKIFTPTGTLLHQFNPFPGGPLLGVRVAAGDINTDGVPELFCATGPGGLPVVRVFNGFTFELIREIPAFGPAFRGGVNMVIGDVLGNEDKELIVGPVTGGPFVKVFDPTTTAGAIRTFTVFPTGSNQGLRLAIGKFSGGAKQEIFVTRAGPSNPVVRVINGDTGALLKSITVFGTFQGGLSIGAVDVTIDAKTELVVSRDASSPPLVNIIKLADDSLVRQIPAYAPAITQGVRVWAGQLFLNGNLSNVITSIGPGAVPRVKVFDAFNGNLISVFDAFATNMTAGVFAIGVIR